MSKRETALAAVLVMAAFVGLFVVAYLFSWFSIPFIGALEQRQTTNRGDYRIQSYEQFYRWHESVSAIDTKLGSYPVESLDRRQRTECQGLLARRADIVQRYNAASRSVETQGQWQAWGLPNTLHQTNTRSC